MKRVSALWTKDKVRSECRFHGESDPLIDGLAFHSKDCTPSVAFVAICGLHADGHHYIQEATDKGCRVIIHSKPLRRYHREVLYIRHPNPRRVASSFAHMLASPLPPTIIGVTGTDGKSTTCDFLWQLLNTCGIRCGLLSTVFMDDGSGKRPSPYRQSTPEVPELYAFLRRCHEHGVGTVVLETTSHGLSDQGARLADISFSGAIYTTLTSEHLEFHRDKESYVDAKMNLARQVVDSGWIVLSHEFSYLQRVSEERKMSVRLCTYALDDDPHGTELSGATLSAALSERTIFLVPSDDCCEQDITIPYGDACYAQNALAAIVACKKATGLPWQTILTHAQALQHVPGRFEIVNLGPPCTLVIDFAHTADAFQKLFSHVRAHHGGRIIAVFGAAGERDRSKRFPMGMAAGSWCDSVYLTAEDPRGEDPEQILGDLEEGIRASGTLCTVTRIHDRRVAIATALEEAAATDIVLLLAKGHETSIQYPLGAIPWNELEVAKELLALRRNLHA